MNTHHLRRAMRTPTHRMILLAASLVGLIAPSAAAQVCTGASSIPRGAFRLGGAIVTGERTRGQVIQLAVGSTTAGRGPFAQLTGSRINRSDAFEADERAARVDPAYRGEVELGRSAPVAGIRDGAFCPVVRAAFTSGPEVTSGTGGDELETEARTFEVALGAWLGASLRAGRGSSLIPALGARMVHEWGEVTNEGTAGGVAIDEAEDRRSTYAVVSMAIGAAMGGRVLLRPQLDIPVGHGGDRPILYLGGGLVIGP
ncbi:MAG TPA: hypothetical protein VFT96_02235 [Gemmatimonadaceae bacterium]|nr:hypothetical protein [Gemmatimonadaceae bacterium]